MTDRPLPRLAKWPFFVADFALLLLASWIMARHPHPLAPWPQFLMVVCVVAAFVFAVWPYVLEFRAALAFSESAELTTAVAEIQKLQSLADQIRLATGQWQTVQDHSGKTVGAAKEIAERMALEAKAFAEFMQKANDSEKGHLRLEVDKFRRNEGEWLQIVVRLLDHVYALNQAGARSGQPNVRQQLNLFQTACREAVRRIGLLPIEAAAGEAFDPARHQLIEAELQPEPGAVVGETLATGYSYQGQSLRPVLVRLASSQGLPESPEAADPSPFHAPPSDVAPSAPEATPAEPELIQIAGAEPISAREPDPEWTAEDEFRLEPETLAEKARRGRGPA